MKTDKLIEFKFIKSILYYEWAYLSLGLMQDDTPVLELWCDVDYENNYNQYAYIFIKPEDCQLLIEAKKSYFNVLKDSLEIILFKYNDTAYDFEVINKEVFLNKYGPQETCDLNEELIEFRKNLVNFNFLNKETA